MHWYEVLRPEAEGWHVNAVFGSEHNRLALQESTECGCFHCARMLEFSSITKWTDAPYGTPPELLNEKGETALCPHCGFDTVIGSESGFPVTMELLSQMQAYWFAPGQDYEYVARIPRQPVFVEPCSYPMDEIPEVDADLSETGDHVDARKFSSRHRQQIENSAACGCFYCLRIFSPQDITQWWEESKNSDLESATAVCPHCGIDAVIGSASGYPITQAFLEKMKGHWFS